MPAPADYVWEEMWMMNINYRPELKNVNYEFLFIYLFIYLFIGVFGFCCLHKIINGAYPIGHLFWSK
jgi:hypothetical protein